MTRIFLLVFCLLLSVGASAQTAGTDNKKKARVVQDQSINDLVYNKNKKAANPTAKQQQGKTAHSTTAQPQKPAPKAESDKKPATGNKSQTGTRQGHNSNTSSYAPRQRYNATGYRIQIYTGGSTRDGKTGAQRAQQKCKNAFPELATYVHFVSPHWVCRVGDFRRIEDAQRYAQKLRNKKVSAEARVVPSNIITTK